MTGIKRSLVVIAALVFLVGALGAALPQPRYKNLKILPRDISQFELNKIMDHFTGALGVTCNYCHKQDKEFGLYEYASDVKPEKEIARRMMLMTKDINARHFSFNNALPVLNAVTCFTCHNGKPMPDTLQAWNAPRKP